MIKTPSADPFTGKAVTFEEVTKILLEKRNEIMDIAKKQADLHNVYLWIATQPEAENIRQILGVIDADIYRAALSFKEHPND